jgi:hypothetical protein
MYVFVPFLILLCVLSVRRKGASKSEVSKIFDTEQDRSRKDVKIMEGYEDDYLQTFRSYCR